MTRHYCRILMEDRESMHHMMTAAAFHFLLNHGSFSLGRHLTNNRNHNNNFRLSTNSCQPPPTYGANLRHKQVDSCSFSNDK